ncbi:hypothetical protein D3C78_1824370 [compost metagenome]
MAAAAGATGKSASSGGSRGARGGGKQKPVIPVALDKAGGRKQLSDEEMEAIIKKASRWEEGRA